MHRLTINWEIAQAYLGDLLKLAGINVSAAGFEQALHNRIEFVKLAVRLNRRGSAIMQWPYVVYEIEGYWAKLTLLAKYQFVSNSEAVAGLQPERVILEPIDAGIVSDRLEDMPELKEALNIRDCQESTCVLSSSYESKDED